MFCILWIFLPNSHEKCKFILSQWFYNKMKILLSYVTLTFVLSMGISGWPMSHVIPFVKYDWENLLNTENNALSDKNSAERGIYLWNTWNLVPFTYLKPEKCIEGTWKKGCYGDRHIRTFEWIMLTELWYRSFVCIWKKKRKEILHLSSIPTCISDGEEAPSHSWFRLKEIWHLGIMYSWLFLCSHVYKYSQQTNIILK